MVATIVPPRCCLCGAAAETVDLDLCSDCARRLPVSGGNGEVAPGRNLPEGLSRAFAPLLYAYPVDHFVRALKFRGERVYARVLGSLLAQALLARGVPSAQLVIPVPLHRERYRQRGFNQAREIARFAAARLHLEVDSQCLVRRVATREQSALSLAARRRNVRRAFEVVCPLRAERVALVDDVVTTGSTASAAARALRAAGAKEVVLWAAACVRRH